MIANFSLGFADEPGIRYVRCLDSERAKKSPFFSDNVSFTSRKSFRKFPILTSFHRATDGALVGVLVAVAIMSTVALHSQYLWTVSFSKLEVTRALTQRLLESTAILENYLLKTSSIPEYMEPTKAKHLIYLTRPKNTTYQLHKDSSEKSLFMRLASYPINHGY